MFCKTCDPKHLRGFCLCPEKVIEQQQEIATITARNAAYETALREISNMPWEGSESPYAQVARAALGEPEPTREPDLRYPDHDQYCSLNLPWPGDECSKDEGCPKPAALCESLPPSSEKEGGA